MNKRATIDDVDQMLLNDLARTDRAIASRKARLAAGPVVRRCAPRRYLVDVPITVTDPVLSVAVDRFEPVTRGVVIANSCKAFRCTELAATIAAIGTVDATNEAAKLSLPAFADALSFQWQIRDTYTDRTWSNAPLPDLALASGKNGGLLLGRAAVLPPGTILEVTIMPIQAPDGVSASNTVGSSDDWLTNVTEYTVQIAFIGDEVYE